jgi:hypothetical protein
VSDSAVRVVGFQGIVTPGRTPGLHAPVVVDAKGQLVDAHGVVEGVALSVDPNEALPGDATRTGPWPHDPTGVVLTADAPVLRALRQRYLQDLRVTAAVRRLLTGLDAENSSELLRREHAERVQGTHVVAWYGPRDEVRVMRGLFCDLARVELGDALLCGDDARVQQRAWALQRAALNADDDLRAIAALQVAGVGPDEARELRDELVRDLPTSQREAAYRKVLKELQGRRRTRGGDQGAAALARMQVRSAVAIGRRDMVAA